MGKMDRHGGCTAEEATGVERWFMLSRKAVQFVAVASFFSFLVSYFSGFPVYNLHFSTLVFSLFAHAADRKYVFLVCNAILAFLVKNLSLSSSSSGGLIKTAEDEVKQMPAISVEESLTTVEYGISPVAGDEATEQQEACSYVVDEADEVIKELEEDDGEIEEDLSAMEEVNDGKVSTEELNKKFEEFIRKMKEEIRIEAQQQIITI